MTAEQLASAAQSASRAHVGRCTYDKWLPAIATLRGKDFTWSQIHQWLTDHGERVPKLNTFKASACRRYKRAMFKMMEAAK